MDTIIQMSEPVIQYAFFWFLPLLFVGGLIGGALLSSDTTKLEGNSIAVLGMKGSGKTTFLHNISDGKIATGEGTSRNKYDSFYVKFGDKTMKIKPGDDIPGGDDFVRSYEEMILKSDICFFVFNAYLYLNNEKYRKETNMRMFHIYDKIQKKNPDVMNKKYAIIATHLDKLPDEGKNALDDIRKIIKNDKLMRIKLLDETLINNNFIAIDARKPDACKKIIEQLF